MSHTKPFLTVPLWWFLTACVVLLLRASGAVEWSWFWTLSVLWGPLLYFGVIIGFALFLAVCLAFLQGFMRYQALRAEDQFLDAQERTTRGKGKL